MAVAQYLADKSAWARLSRPTVADAMRPLLMRGLIGTTGIIDLELLYSERNGSDHDRALVERAAYEWFPMTDEAVARAIEVQNLLAHRGQHRAVPIPGLLLAAVAERHDIALLHYDRDFDHIAEVTEQRTEWVVPSGTAD